MQESADYSAAMERKYPEQIVIAIAKDANGKCNPITLGWMMNTSGSPPMLAISIGLSRYSLDVIRHARAFVVSMPSMAMTREVKFFGSRSGRNTDKLAELQTPATPATEIDCVLLSDAVANFECRLDSELLTGDHVIFAGEVVASHMNTDPSVRRIYSLSEGFGGVQRQG